MQSDNHIEIHKDGITYLACGKYTEGNNRYISHLLKDGDKDGIEYAAKRMAKIIPPDINGILVPIPGHTGRAIQTKELAKKIAQYTNLPVMDVIKGKFREALYTAKKEGKTLTSIDLGFYQFKDLPIGKFPILIDNCCDTGCTAKCAFNALGKGIIVTFSNTENIKNSYYKELTEGQKSRLSI